MPLANLFLLNPAFLLCRVWGWIFHRKTSRVVKKNLTGSWAIFYVDKMCFHLELGWQFFLALLTDFMLSWTKLSFNGYWDPFPLHVFQLWHLEISLRKSLTIWVSSSLNTCTTDTPLSLSTVSPSLPLQLSPSDSLPQSVSRFTNRNQLMDSGQSFFQPTNVTGDFFICSVSITCHKVENVPATLEEAQIYLEVSPPAHREQDVTYLQNSQDKYFFNLSFEGGSLGLPLSRLSYSAASLCPYKRLFPSAPGSPLLSWASPSAANSLLNSPLPPLHPLQAQVRVARRKFFCHLWSSTAGPFSGMMVKLRSPHKVQLHTHALLLTWIACWHLHSLW